MRIEVLPQNSKRRKGDTTQVPHWESINIRCRREIIIRPGDMAPDTFHPWTRQPRIWSSISGISKKLSHLCIVYTGVGNRRVCHKVWKRIMSTYN